jgi:hypothetical protein
VLARPRFSGHLFPIVHPELLTSPLQRIAECFGHARSEDVVMEDVLLFVVSYQRRKGRQRKFAVKVKEVSRPWTLMLGTTVVLDDGVFAKITEVICDLVEVRWMLQLTVLRDAQVKALLESGSGWQENYDFPKGDVPKSFKVSIAEDLESPSPHA